MTPEKKMSVHLYPVDRSMKREWFIKYEVRNFDTGKVERRKYKGILNLIADYDERMVKAREYISLLEMGMVPETAQGLRYVPAPSAKKNFANTVQLCETFIKHLEADVEPVTYQGYNSKLRRFKIWMTEKGFANLPIGAFDKPKAKAFLNYLKLELGQKNTTVNDYKSVLGLIWREIMDSNDEIKVLNPWSMIPSKKDDTVSYEKYPIALEKKIIKELPTYDPQLWLFIQFVYYDFMRPTEIRRLLLSDIDWSNGTLYLDERIIKKSKPRRVLIPYPVLEQLINLGFDTCDQDQHIFSNNGGPGRKMLSKNIMSRRWSVFRLKFDIPNKYQIYGWKHTGNKKLALTGTNPYMIMQHNGHASLDQTMDYIGKLDAGDMIPLRESFPKMGTDVRRQDTSYDKFIKTIKGVTDAN